MTAGPDDDLVLAIDLGSSGLKVGYTTLTGEPRWWQFESIPTTYEGPAVTQDARAWWRSIVRIARRGLAEGGLDGSRVVGVGITGQWGSVVPVDSEGMPVAEAVMWNDQRGSQLSAAIVGGPIVGYSPRPALAWLRRTGGVPNPTGQDAMSQLLYLTHERPEVSAAARWFLEPVDYLAMRFTGRAAATPMSVLSSWLTDNRDLAQVDYDARLVRMSGVDRAKLPPLVPSGTIVGTVRPEVADLIGISRAAQLATGAPDLHCAVVGSGCVRPFEAHLSIGTTGWITCPVPFKKTDVLNQMASVPGIGDGQYVLVNNQDNAGRCLEWFRDTLTGFGASVSFGDLLALAATAEPGSGGALFTPWLTGERSTLDDRNVRAGFHNVGIQTGAAELARAVLEGVAFNSRLLLDVSERFAGHQFEPLRIVGGGARSDLWCQIVADVTDHTVERIENPIIVGLRGASLILALALGAVSHDEIRSLVPVDRAFIPDSGTRDTYDRLYAEFPRLHSRNKAMFARLNG